MSWSHVHLVKLTKRPRWTPGRQQLLLEKWAERFREDWGYGLWAVRDLVAAIGVQHGQINRLTRQLEQVGVGGRLPMTHDRIGDFNRYYIRPEAFEDRRHDCDTVRARLALASTARCPKCVGSPIVSVEGQVVERRGGMVDTPAARPVEKPLFEVAGLGLDDQGADPPGSGGADPPGSGGLILQDQPYKQVQDLVHKTGTSSTSTAAQARLDALLVDVAHRKNYALSTAPADDGNYAHVAKAVREVLADPGYAVRLKFKGYDPARDDDVCELARRLCDRRHILTGKHPRVKWDVIDRALRSERAKAAIARGAARGRDAAAEAAAKRRRWRGVPRL